MKIVLITLAICLPSWFLILFVVYSKTGKLSLPAMVISHTLVACIGLPLTHFWTVADNESKPFKAVINNETRYYNVCEKENGHNVCEADFGKEVVVDDFWKNET